MIFISIGLTSLLFSGLIVSGIPVKNKKSLRIQKINRLKRPKSTGAVK